MSFNRIGGILEAQGDFAGALAEFCKGLAIRKQLVTRAPDSAVWQRGLGVNLIYLGHLYKNLNDPIQSESHLNQAVEIFAKLENPTQPGSSNDIAIVLALSSESAMAMNNFDQAKNFDRDLMRVAWTPAVALEGTFRCRFLPNLLERLDIAYDHCAPDLKADLLERCIQVCRAAPHIDAAPWYARRQQMASPCE